MKKNWKNRLLFTTIGIALLMYGVSCTRHGEHAEHIDTYTCPMHPTVISNRPGTCPVCGMDLVRKVREGEAIKITEHLSKLIKSPNETIISSIKTIKGEYKSMPISIKAQGVVTYDTRTIYTISTRFDGRLEKVFLKYAFQPVRKGQKIAEIYSPALLMAQRELLFLIANDPENKALIQRAKERLNLLGASELQLNELIQSQALQTSFSLYSPYSGYVISDTQQTPGAPITSPATVASNGTMTNGMSDGSSTSSVKTTASISVTPGALVREGSYVSSGQTLFKIVDPSALRVELNIASHLTGVVKKDNKVNLDFGDQQYEEGTVDFVQPFFSEGQEFLTVRVYTKNTKRLRIGHLVNAIIDSTPVDALWVPKQAVLHLGIDNIVFIKEKNAFKPKKVVTGVRTENQIEIIHGLSSSDEIASNSQYLVDSESFINTK